MYIVYSTANNGFEMKKAIDKKNKNHTNNSQVGVQCLFNGSSRGATQRWATILKVTG